MNFMRCIKSFVPLSACIVLMSMSLQTEVMAHNNKHGNNFYTNDWYDAHASYSSTGESFVVRYRDKGQADSHCPYVKVRAASGYRITESSQNCSLRTNKSISQGLLNADFMTERGNWRVCRSGHWQCRWWRYP